MPSYVCFLKGINVGGRIIKMVELKKAFEALKFKNIKTLLASGNVHFESDSTSIPTLVKTIEAQLTKTFHYPARVMIRSLADIEKLIKSDPFKGIKVTPQTRLYVSFFWEKPKSKAIPATAKNFKILYITDSEIISVLTLMPDFGTVDSMTILNKAFGKDLTTRNWNTVKKLVK